jgi:2-dehydropantoate 2-reductase
MAQRVPKVLVVGAGSVGQVFGWHLLRAGAELTFFVRETRRDETARGFDVYRLRMFGAPERSRLVGFDVVARAEEVAGQQFDQIYLAVPSQALIEPWLPELAAVARDATWISIQPGPQDRRALVEAGVPSERLVSGMLSLVSYQAPLQGETPARFPVPGMAFWHPPLSPSLFSGPAERLRPVLELLRRGGFPARRSADVHRRTAFLTAVLLSYLAALERSGWSLRDFRRSGALRLGAAVARETSAIVAATDGPRTPVAHIAGHATFVRFALWLANKAAPFPLEAYLQSHFTKTHAQTEFILLALRARATESSMRVHSLDELLSRPRSLEEGR